MIKKKKADKLVTRLSVMLKVETVMVNPAGEKVIHTTRRDEY